MPPTLHILHLEANPLDSDRVAAHLRREGLAVEMDRVETLARFQAALELTPYTLVLGDYTVPGLDSRAALRWVREHYPEIPFIFVSGTVGEEVAIDLLKLGASDFVVKPRLARLVPAIQQALQDAAERTRRRRAEAEQALRQSEEKFRAVFEQAAVGMGRVSLTDARWIDVNEAFCRMLGYTAEELRATPWPQITHPDDVDLDLAPFRRLAAGEIDGYTVEKRFLHKDGHHVWARLTLSLARDPQGRPDYEIAIIEDITHTKQAEALLRRALRNVELERLRLAAIFEALPAGVAIADADGKVTHFNAALTRIWGKPPLPKKAEDYGQWRGYWAETGLPLAAADWAMARALSTGQMVPGDIIEIEKFDGSGRATIINAAAPIRDDNGQIIGGVVAEVDITAQKQAEAALRESEQRERQRANELATVVKTRDEVLAQLDALLANAPVGFAFFDREHRYVRVNDYFALQLDGLPVEAHLGRPVREVLPVNAQAIEPLLDTIFHSGKPLANVVVTVETPATPGEQRHWLTAWFPVQTPDGSIPWVGAAVMEITQQKRTELALQKTREELAGANSELEQRVNERTAELREAMVEMEQMSYSMIHDLRAPLRAIQSFGGIIEEDPESRLSPPSREFLSRMRAAATRMDHLVLDVLNYSKVVRGQLPLGPVDTGRLIRGIVQTYPDLQPPRAEVTIAPNLPIVHGNEAALTQCFSQLLTNAVKFVAPGVQPRIRVLAEPAPPRPPAATLHEPLPAESPSPRSAPPSPRFIRIVVEDNGVGMAPAAKKKVFGIFQRLTHRPEGTGMGLAIVRKATERMGGRVGVESEPGKGSRFWLELPLG